MPAVSCPRIAPEDNYNKHSGGFPHSEIHGSKPIPGSPWLNAGYHVLHRLLLPRHPPNALLALDLIQKEQGPADMLQGRLSDQKSYILPYRKPWFVVCGGCVLDLEQYRLADFSAINPTLGAIISDTDVSLSQRCQCRPVGRWNTSQSVRRSNRLSVSGR